MIALVNHPLGVHSKNKEGPGEADSAPTPGLTHRTIFDF